MYLHSKEYAFRYTDADFQDIVRPASLLSVMQESACLSADELGFGYDNLKPKNIGFILSNWYVELTKPIAYDSVIDVHTWPIKPGRAIVMRDFELYIGGETVGVGTSRWCLVDLALFSMLPSSAVFGDIHTEFNQCRSTEFNSWKIPRITEGERTYEKIVSYSDCDHYNHANNTKYADLLMDAFSVAELKGRWVKQFRISYIRQCKCGEKLDFYRMKLDGDDWLTEARAGDELRAQMYVSFGKI